MLFTFILLSDPINIVTLSLYSHMIIIIDTSTWSRIRYIIPYICKMFNLSEVYLLYSDIQI